MDLVAQLVINTLQIGAIYVLFSLGLTLIFGVMKIVNFAHGEFFSLCALVTVVVMPLLLEPLGLPLGLAYLLSAASGVLLVLALGYCVYTFGFQKYSRDLVGSFIVSIGLLLALQGTFIELFTGVPRVMPALIEGNVSILGGRLPAQRLVIIAVAVLITVGLYVFLQHSKLGKALRAVSEDQEAAMLQGIRYQRISLYGFLIGALLAGVAGALIAPLTVVSPIIGSDYLIKSFIIIIIGGLGSIPGAIVAGFLIASIESVVGYLYDLSTATIAMFVIVIVFLLVRPQGLMGHVQK